jgi:hypothetical protein
MNSEFCFQTAFCNKYESLLHECQLTKETWAEFREAMNAPSEVNKLNKEAGSELLRLQANYAKAYTRLEQHNQDCDLCQFATRMAAQQREYAILPIASEERWLA